MQAESASTRRHLEQELTARGIRMTHQRRLLVQIMQRADGHMEAVALWQRARAQDPTLNKGSITSRSAQLRGDVEKAPASDSGELPGSIRGEWRFSLQVFLTEAAGQDFKNGEGNLGTFMDEFIEIFSVDFKGQCVFYSPNGR